MRNLSTILLMPFLFATTVGCGQSTNRSGTSLSSSKSDDAIAEVAQVFLEAIRTGDSTVAASQLTPLAQQRMRAADMDFQLPENAAATYQVGRVEILEDGEAIVETVYSEPNAEGAAQEEQWTFALRLSEGQWRILGIVAQADPNQAPDVMDFENPGNPFKNPGNSVAPPNTASTTPAGTSTPQQAARPAPQDPFRQ